MQYKTARGAFHHRGHTWILWRRDGKLVVGMDDLLHRIVGGFDEVRLPEPGTSVSQGEKAVLVRQGDRVLWLPSPASGTVIEANTAIRTDPSLAKKDPYDTGWLFILSPSRPDEDLLHLMISRRAEDWLRREVERMRVFFDDLLQKGAALQDSAAPSSLDGILERLDYNIWVFFKDQFIYQQEWRT